MARPFFVLGAALVATAAAAATGCGDSAVIFGTGGSTSSSGTGTGTGGGGGGASSSTGTVSSSSGTGGGAGSSSGAGAGGAVSALGPGDLVITEIMNNSNAVLDNAGEWFELHNPTGSAIDLAGLVLDDGMGTDVIGASVMVAAGGYVVLGVNADPATNGGVPVAYQYLNTKFLNTKGGLTVRTAASVVIDAMSYDEASGLDPDGASRNLSPSFLSAAMNDTDLHWCAASSFIKGNAGDRGTPGKANDPCP